MGSGYSFRDGDWPRLRQIIQKLASLNLGIGYTPVFTDLTLTNFSSTETISEILFDTLNRGVLDAVTITADNGVGSAGLDISWTAGEIWDHGNSLVGETDSADAQTCTDDALNYLFWSSGSGLTLSATAPTGEEVIVGRIFIQDGIIWDIDQDNIVSEREAEIADAIEALFPSIVASGMVVSESAGGVAFDVNMTQGVYYLAGHDRHTVSALNSPTMTRWFHDGGGNWVFDTNTQIDSDFYDSGTGLVAFTGGNLTKYWRSSFFVVDESLHWIYPTTDHVTVAQAIAGASPAKPGGLEAFPRSVDVILRGNSTAFPAADSDRWIDTRPKLGTSMTGIVSDHGELAGLGDVGDHLLYLDLAGTRAMTGNTLTLGIGQAADITIKFISAGGTGSINWRDNDDRFEISGDTLFNDDVDITGPLGVNEISRLDGGVGVKIDPTSSFPFNVEDSVEGLYSIRIKNTSNHANAYTGYRAFSDVGNNVSIFAHSSGRTTPERWGGPLGNTSELLSVGVPLCIGTFSTGDGLVLGTEKITALTIDGTTQDITVDKDLKVKGGITILNATPILIFKDSNDTGDDSVGFIEWRDSANTRLGFFGNSTNLNDDLLWKNESAGGHIGIQTIGGGEFRIFADTVLNGNSITGIGTITATTLTVTNTITEFSTDVTLGGDSDSAVPTEKAVKTYVDAQVGGGFVDRGDPAGWDLSEGDGDTDFSSVGDTASTWYEFNLNTVAGVPVAAKAVLITMRTKIGFASIGIQIRDSANANTFNVSQINTQVPAVRINLDLVCPITDGKVDIRSVGGKKFSDFTDIDLVVKGWWL